MKLNVSQGRMFKSVTHTGTYFQGCDHLCPDCFTQWAFAHPISHVPKLVQTDEYEILKVKDATTFLNSAHDSGANCIPDDWILAMFRWIGRQDPSNAFLIQSQNIKRFAVKPFFSELLKIKDRVIISTTIRTNRETPCGKVPMSNNHKMGYLARYREYGFRIRLSHEPLWTFDAEKLLKMDQAIKPELIEIGLDNYAYRHKLDLPKPDPIEYEVYRTMLSQAGIKYNEKDSIKKWRQTEEYKKALGVSDDRNM